ncbi:uncharacterized protein L203_101764 [Cryptococcus depauperatus CBS 7841]|uniref:Uncharacterized protein n=1 Tax=Cryptococcus depauperatus CBS 7841 TaxID=1295531 RepID=A0AAJ8M0H3_9TREE
MVFSLDRSAFLDSKDTLQQADMRAADTPECIWDLKKTRPSQQQHYQAYCRHAHTSRSPSTPRSYSIDWASLDKPSVHLSGCPTILQRRPRSHSAPSVFNTLSTFPFSHRTLLPSSEHDEDRMKALKNGEWAPWSYDIVAPCVLPYSSPLSIGALLMPQCLESVRCDDSYKLAPSHGIEIKANGT